LELIYARWLRWGTRIALVMLTGAFLAYTLAVLEALIPLERLPQVWNLPLDRFLAATGAPTGWHWLPLVRKGDYANLLGVAMLGLVTVACYLRVIPVLLRRGERALALLAALQTAVLLAAASGLLAGGH
jgi:hypothetical protein